MKNAEKDFAQLKLENQLCFPLYACSKEVVKKYKPYLDAIGLTYTQYITMMVMWEHKKLNVTQIGEKLYLDSGTLTPLLKTLEKKGLIERRRWIADERVMEIILTEKGAALKERATSVPEKVRGCLNISSEEAQTLYDLLYKVLKND